MRASWAKDLRKASESKDDQAVRPLPCSAAQTGRRPPSESLTTIPGDQATTNRDIVITRKGVLEDLQSKRAELLQELQLIDHCIRTLQAALCRDDKQ